MPEREYEPSPLSSFGEQETIGDFTRWRLDSLEITNQLRHSLKGDVYNEELGKWVKLGKPLMNDDGISLVISYVETVANKITFLSNLTENDIVLICRNLGKSFAMILLYKYDKLGVSKEDDDFLFWKVMEFGLIALKKSQVAGERE